jgi:hypothetical protein
VDYFDSLIYININIFILCYTRSGSLLGVFIEGLTIYIAGEVFRKEKEYLIFKERGRVRNDPAFLFVSLANYQLSDHLFGSGPLIY